MTKRPPMYDSPRPEVRDGGYLSVTHAIKIAATPQQVRRWNSDPVRGLDEVIVETKGVPRVVGTQNLRGDWVPDSDRTGQRRRVEFDNRHFLAEEVLADTPEVFRYMIWGFTDYRRFVIRHGVAGFEFIAEADGATRLLWTYAFAPKARTLRPFLADFLTGPMSVMMRDTLQSMKDGIESDLVPRP